MKIDCFCIPGRRYQAKTSRELQGDEINSCKPVLVLLAGFVTAAFSSVCLMTIDIDYLSRCDLSPLKKRLIAFVWE